MTVPKDLSYEAALQELEQIVRQLESGELDLEDSLKMFEKGIELTRFSQSKLQEAEQKVKILLDKHGSLELETFTPSDSNNS